MCASKIIVKSLIERNDNESTDKTKGYKAALGKRQTELGIKLIKEFFQQNLSTELRLSRVTAPLFVLKGLGINDDLNGVERQYPFY